MDQQVMPEKKKRTKVELVVILVVIVLAVLTFGIRFFMSNKAVKETALMAELKSIRTSVQLYLITNKGYPPDLKALATQKFKLGDRQEPYLRGVKVDKENYPIDAFGNRFNYDARNGWVQPSEKNYAGW
jgi:competence protein ComGC